MRFLIWVLVNALALAAATWIMDGISLTDSTRSDQVLTLIGVALVFGVVNAIVRPIANLLSLPLIVLTLGLMIFVVNALMLLLTSWISGKLGLGFHVDGFWTALGGALVITVATWLLGIVLKDNK